MEGGEALPWWHFTEERKSNMINDRLTGEYKNKPFVSLKGVQDEETKI